MFVLIAAFFRFELDTYNEDGAPLLILPTYHTVASYPIRAKHIREYQTQSHVSLSKYVVDSAPSRAMSIHLYQVSNLIRRSKARSMPRLHNQIERHGRRHPGCLLIAIHLNQNRKASQKVFVRQMTCSETECSWHHCQVQAADYAQYNCLHFATIYGRTDADSWGILW